MAALSALWWLPPPLHSRPASQLAPRTVAREVNVALSKLLPGDQRSAFAADGRGGVRFSRAIRTRPVMVCPGIRFTTFGIAWSQAGSGSIAATVQTGPTSRRLGTPTVAQAEDAGPDLDASVD